MANAGSHPLDRSEPDLETTVELLTRVRDGDGAARERLVSRYLPMLQRWAHGRLPGHARGLADTDDLVQVTLLRALDRIGGFEPCGEGMFLAYLRRIVLNSIRDEIRRSMRRGEHIELDEAVPDPAPSVVELAIGHQALQAYEAALASLPDEQQEAVILRIEFGYSHQEIATALGKPSSNTARMIVVRGLVRLAERMGERRA